MDDAAPLAADSILEPTAPPLVDLFREDPERRLGRDCHEDRNGRLVAGNATGVAQLRGSRLVRSACCLNASSCSPQNASTSSSQPRSSENGSRSRQYTRTRASCSRPSSLTSPALRSTRRCRLIAGRVIARASAISLARRGLARSRSTTPRRVGSASAASVRSTLPGIRVGVADALHEEPLVALGVQGSVGAVRPVVLAVVVGLGLAEDLGTPGARVSAVGIDVVDDDAEDLRVSPLSRPRAHHALLPRPLVVSSSVDHDEARAEHELRVLDTPPLALDLEADFEA